MPADQSPEPVGLEPCPICRSVKTKLQQGGDWAFVECRECGTAGPAWEDPEEAEVSWNTRAPDPELATLRAQLAEAVDLLDQIVSEFGSTIELYHRIGPHWTHKDGTEVFEVSSILDREPLINAASATVAKIKGGE